MIKDFEKKTNEVDLVHIFKLLWIDKKFIITFTASILLLTVLYTLTLDNIYKATVTIIPQGKDSGASKFSNLVALAGIDLNSDNISNEALYSDVLKSDLILDKVISRKWLPFTKQDSMYLDKFLNIKSDPTYSSPNLKLIYETKKYIREKIISFKTSKENGLMTLSISIPNSPKIATDMANFLSDQLHVFNEMFRQQKANENLISIKNQLDDAKKELTKVENSIRDFKKSNKNFLQSSILQLEHDRLNRELLTENTVYTELRKQFEIAKIELQKNKKTILILDKATVPIEKDKPSRALICIIATILGFILAVTFSIIKQQINLSK